MESAKRQQEVRERLQLIESLVQQYSTVSKLKIRKPSIAHVYQCDWLAKILGVELELIISGTESQSCWDVYARWDLKLPMRLGHVATCQLSSRNTWPKIPKLRLSPQNTIPPNSEIIKACESGDIARIQHLLSMKAVHPNDRTPDNLTVLRHGICTGDPAIVQLLLDHGADPNLTFGQYETRPLMKAFWVGNVETIRLLLKAKAEPDYKNKSGWTAAAYLWDPERPALEHLNEIMILCKSHDYEAWNEVDEYGWTPCHRAGAYGRGEDIHALSVMGANLHMYTTSHLWGPITVAVDNQNDSTFDAFMDLFPVQEIITLQDTRGWTLLHMAAQVGNEHMIKKLLHLGADTTALTIGAYNWMYECLRWKRVTPETVARAYGHGDLWDKLVRNS